MALGVHCRMTRKLDSRIQSAARQRESLLPRTSSSGNQPIAVYYWIRPEARPPVSEYTYDSRSRVDRPRDSRERHSARESGALRSTTGVLAL